MNKTTNIIQQSFEFYDNNRDKNHNLFKDITHVSYVADSKEDSRMDVVQFYKNDKKPVMKANYQVIGIYNNQDKIWVWAWSVPNLPKRSTFLSRKILTYGLDLDYHINSFLKTELITSRFKISDITQVDIHIAIASYISKHDIIFEVRLPNQYDTTSDMPPLVKDNNVTNFTSYFLALYNMENIN